MIELDQLKPHLLHHFNSEVELLRGIEELSHLYNIERSKLKLESFDERLVSAYVLFFMSTNLPLLSHLLPLLPRSVVGELARTKLIEFGCGPGTFAQAWARYFSAEQVLGGIDQSPLMREQSKRLWKAFFASAPCEFLDMIPRVWREEATTLLFANSANEMAEEAVLETIAECSPNWLLFIEPGTHQSFHHLLSMRDSLLKKYKLVYPCVSNSPCPLTGQQNWCHQVLELRHSQSIERLTQMARKDRRQRPVVFHVYCLDAQTDYAIQRQALLFRKKKLLKYGVLWELCTVINDANTIVEVELHKKDYTKKQWKNFMQIPQGGTIRFVLNKKIRESLWKITLSDD